MHKGDPSARILVLGEFPSSEDFRRQVPFSGTSGEELSRMLHEAGFLTADCFFTYVHNTPPFNGNVEALVFKNKKNPPVGFVFFRGKWVASALRDSVLALEKFLSEHEYDLILCLGNLALWAVSDYDSVAKWRGSQLVVAGRRILPTYSPSLVQRSWDLRAIVVQDFRRANQWLSGSRQAPTWQFIVRPSFERTLDTLEMLIEKASQSSTPLLLSVDLETRVGHTACCGIAWSRTEAISIPFMCLESASGYFDNQQEAAVVYKIRTLLEHPQVAVVGQNFSYDAQYFHRHWHYVPNVRDDTLVAQGLLFPGLPKALDFLASMYCDHYIYWKDDGKLWDISIPEEKYWAYNCEDACRTYEIISVQKAALAQSRLLPQYDYLMKLWFAVLGMMLRGVRIDKKNRQQITMELLSAMGEREAWFTQVLGHPLNPRSTPQMQKLFYEDLRAPIQRKRGTNSLTLDDKALEKINVKAPLLRPLIKTIQEYRSLGVFLGTFAQAPLDIDERMRCSYGIVGTETFRFNSSADAFDSGTNLQNIPKVQEKVKPGELSMPNMRGMFIPDPGMLIADADLDRADLQVVVWEADDEELKCRLREGVDIHTENAKDLGVSRPLAKAWVHGTNYGGSPRTMAVNCGITVHQAEKMQHRWFEAHPGIKAWHDRTLESLQLTRSVTNKFGFRRFYFDRIEGILPEALAWVPQSTVAIVINKGLLEIATNLPEVEILLQVHDSLVFQFPERRQAELLPKIRDSLLIKIPYDDPLIIPVGLKLSPHSWGDCKPAAWS